MLQYINEWFSLRIALLNIKTIQKVVLITNTCIPVAHILVLLRSVIPVTCLNRNTKSCKLALNWEEFCYQWHNGHWKCCNDIPGQDAVLYTVILVPISNVCKVIQSLVELLLNIMMYNAYNKAGHYSWNGRMISVSNPICQNLDVYRC